MRNVGEEPAEAAVSLLTQLRRPCASLLTDDGTELGDVLADGQSAFAAQPEAEGITPLFIISGRVGPRPNVRNNRNYQFTITYDGATLAPGSSMAVVHAVAQRRDVNAAGVRQSRSCSCRVACWRGIPSSIRSSIVNLGGTEIRAGETASRPPDDLRAIRLLAAEVGVSRDDNDHLLLDGDNLLHGVLTGGDISITVNEQALSFPLDAIAGIVGGAGANRPHRLYLRDGSVLVGHIAPIELAMATDQGWDVTTQPDELDVLLLRQESRR